MAAGSPAVVADGVPRIRDAAVGYDVERVRADFPILSTTVHGHPLAYLDTAATSQKPQVVIDAVARFYAETNANVHRGVYHLSERATAAYEAARARAGRFLGAASAEEIVFTRGTTEAINLVAASFSSRLGPGDEVLLTAMEHHSNIVPWQMACERTGANLVVAPMDARGVLDLEAMRARITERTRIVALAHVSNALGTINPVADVCALARGVGAAVLVDGAQAAPHMPIDVRALGCDFYAFSGHKAYGPTGIGVLYAKRPWLEELPPYQGGGEMIRTVTFERTEYAAPPAKFEAGTPPIAGAVGLAEALDYIAHLDRAGKAEHEADVVAYAAGSLAQCSGVELVGTAPDRAAVVAFTVDGIHPHDLATIVDHEGIAIRAGHHCAQPVMKHFGVTATARASFGVYSRRDEVDRLTAAIGRAHRILGV
jgi:cysteine desulfurase/selenocysteine lyase